MRKRKLPPIENSTFLGSTVIDGEAPFTATVVRNGKRDERDRRHARGNWPSHIMIVLRGPEALFGRARNNTVQRLESDVGKSSKHITIEDEEGDDDEEEHEEAKALYHFAQVTSNEAMSAIKKIAPAAILTPHFPIESTSEDLTAIDVVAADYDVKSSDTRWAHISLSRPFSLQKHEIEPFVNTLHRSLSGPGCPRAFDVFIGREWCILPSEAAMKKNCESSEAGNAVTEKNNSTDCSSGNADSSDISKNNTHLNDDTRGYLTLEIQQNAESGDDKLLSLVRAVDAALKEFGRPPFFSPPRFHVSVAHIDGIDPAILPFECSNQELDGSILSKELSSGSGSAALPSTEDSGSPACELAMFTVNELEVRIGHIRYIIPLRSTI